MKVVDYEWNKIVAIVLLILLKIEEKEGGGEQTKKNKHISTKFLE